MDVNRKSILSLVIRILEEASTRKVDLSLDKDRKELADVILKKISSKVYMISYSTQDTFE